ncbi:hypothetical protein CANCADRAFT_2664 [Tortispora caseinolytica NRRL Y-17796]|uniref:Conserved oligomeric Golgi complex subunit 5 N-terminal domain-containing protein n=1 Tax=Tortispora caseinolytica NRRL Y-17796 TaxID=767744 RepID=A0A1E4TGW5_9ASCO|nr:hypothetical protein CANCADRAFT_2664 [Tortispora caseinolytica NRRL Y-17796]
MSLRNQYINFDRLLSDNFNPSTYANILVLETHTESDDTVDLGPAKTKANFELDEVNIMLSERTNTHSRDILKFVDSVDQLSSKRDDLKEKVNYVSSSYQRLVKDISIYYDAHKIHEDLVRDHETMAQLRQLAHYLGLVRQIALSERTKNASYGSSLVSLINESKDFLLAHPQIQNLDTATKANQSVLRIETDIRKWAISNLLKVTEYTDEASFDVQLISSASLCLFAMSPKLFSSTIRDIQYSLVSSSLPYLLNSSPTMVTQSLKSISTKASMLGYFEQILAKTYPNDQNLASYLKNGLSRESFVSEFWIELASGWQNRLSRQSRWRSAHGSMRRAVIDAVSQTAASQDSLAAMLSALDSIAK